MCLMHVLSRTAHRARTMDCKHKSAQCTHAHIITSHLRLDGVDLVILSITGQATDLADVPAHCCRIWRDIDRAHVFRLAGAPDDISVQELIASPDEFVDRLTANQ